jgi:1-acyl-sn-glycerol-3-phosphate acyltransferase
MLAYIFKKLFVLYFKLSGWKLKGEIPSDFEKGVLIFAPHTSSEDFVHTLACATMMNVQLKYLAKEELFKFPVKGMMMDMGGVPVNRANSNNLVEHMINMLKESKKLIIAIPAEGTRKKTTKWKTGFYHVAVGAKVPVLLAYLDYKNKLAGVGDIFYPTGNQEADFDYIEKFYLNANAKYPEMFNNKIR